MAADAPSAVATRAPVGSLRRRAARGTIVNAVFLVGFAGVGLVQRVIVAKLLTPDQYGLWGAVLVTLLAILFVKNAGIGDKFVQQDEADQIRAFQHAFTIDVVLALACVALAVVAFPLFALAYGQSSLVLPGLVLSLAIVGNSLQAPVWIHYRDLDYGRQRLLQAIDPTTNFVVTVTLAAVGAGYWSLVIGALAGAWTGGLVAVALCPYPLRFALDRGSVRAYFRFSWPVVVAGGTFMGVGQASQLMVTRVVGLAGTGGLNVAYSFGAFADGVDGIVTQTIYPAICRVRHRTDLLLEIFVKSNRLALLWGMPFGIGVALFAEDIVHFVVGNKWEFAVHLIQAFGVVAAIDQLGFNWTAFLRALDQTRPLATLGIIGLTSFVVIELPLLLVAGLDGFAAGWVAWGVFNVLGRTYFLRALFPGFNMIRHCVRAILPCVPAVAVVMVARQFEDGDGTDAVGAFVELCVYGVVAAVASIYFERALLREAVSYLRRPR